MTGRGRDGGVGTEVVVTLRVAGYPLHETFHVVGDVIEPDGSGHTRFEFEGSMPGWQVWEARPEGDGTLLSTELEYAVPGSVLGKGVDRLLFEKMSKRDMRHSLEKLKRFVEESRRTP